MIARPSPMWSLPSLRPIRRLNAHSRIAFLHLASAAALVTGSQNAAFTAESQPADAPPPWGRLVRTPIYLEASRFVVDSLPLPNTQPRWSFQDDEMHLVPQLLRESGLPQALVEALTQPNRTIVADGWFHLFPSPADILSLDHDTRSRLYTLLGRHETNEYYHSPVFILTDTVEDWYRSSRLRKDLVQLISRLACRRKSVWTFSDIPLLISQAQSDSEARQIFKTCTRTRSYLVRLDVGSTTDATAVKNYWTIGGGGVRRKDIEPFIESIQETGEELRLDLAHILPPLVRKLLYSYPGPEHAAQGMLPDCHWTALNFYNYEAHSYLLDPRLATSKVLEDFEPVEPPYRYGDILFFLDNKAGDAFHSCVYLAEDLVFTKNGRNFLAPWIISTLDDVSRVYLSTTEGHLQAYRKKLEPPAPLP